MTPTGRLTKSQPNLQNIPIRTEEGRKVKEAYMGDMGDIFRAMTAANKERKSRNLIAAQQIGSMFVRHTDYHWSYTLEGKRLDYWPSTNKWHWDGKKFTGTAMNLVRFIQKREKTQSTDPNEETQNEQRERTAESVRKQEPGDSRVSDGNGEEPERGERPF